MKRALLSFVLVVSALHDATAAAPAAKPKRVAAKVANATLCGARKPCKIVETLPAGRGAKAEDLVVYKLALGKDAELGCDEVEYWLLSSREGKVVSTEALLELCNDGYGTAGVGDDTVEVKDNYFLHAQHGGSAWRWGYMHAYQLSPLRELRSGDDSEWVNGETMSASSWDWNAFQGQTEWYVPACGPDGAPPDVDATGGTDPASHLIYAPIPVVAAPAALGQDGWKATSLGHCSLLVDGTPGYGYTIHGKADVAPEDDSSFRVVMLDHDTLLVEVFDDRAVSGSSKWLYDDHLELWLSTAGTPEASQEQCLTPAPKPEQWGIRLVDGKVFAAAGKPKDSPVVTSVPLTDERGHAQVRFRIQLPRGRERITLVYSDSDDGKRQERLIATSVLKFGAGYTLGARLPIDAREAVCEVVGDALEVRQTRTFDPKVPVDRVP
jgi:hypothetical protein